jgi:hypothetical protein
VIPQTITSAYDNAWHGTEQQSHSSYIGAVAGGAYNVARQGSQVGQLLIPSLYRYRTQQIFDEASLSVGDIAYFALREKESDQEDQAGSEDDPSDAQANAYQKLKHSCDRMIDDLVEEWRTFNIASAMLIP